MIAGYILPFRWQFTKILIGRKYYREGIIVDKKTVFYRRTAPYWSTACHRNCRWKQNRSQWTAGRDAEIHAVLSSSTFPLLTDDRSGRTAKMTSRRGASLSSQPGRDGSREPAPRSNASREMVTVRRWPLAGICWRSPADRTVSGKACCGCGCCCGGAQSPLATRT